MELAVPERVFLGWDRPLLPSVSDWLLSEPEKVASTIVIVPTSNSGRRLRLNLSAQANGVVAPRVMAPSGLFAVKGTASRSQMLLAWVKVLQSISPTDYPALFPNHSKGSFENYVPAISLAQQLLRLREELADADIGFRDVIQAKIESERWEDLCVIEGKANDLLKKWGVKDDVIEKRRKASQPELPAGVGGAGIGCMNIHHHGSYCTSHERGQTPKIPEARSRTIEVRKEVMPATQSNWMAWPRAVVFPPPLRRFAL